MTEPTPRDKRAPVAMAAIAEIIDAANKRESRRLARQKHDAACYAAGCLPTRYVLAVIFILASIGIVGMMFGAATPDFRLQLKANNAAELKLVDELDKELDKTGAALTASKADAAAIKQAADALKAERDKNGAIALKNIEKNKALTSFSDQMHAWDGGGAIWWGLTRWALHIALALGALAGVLTVLSIFFPPVGLILGTIGRNLLSLAVRRVAS